MGLISGIGHLEVDVRHWHYAPEGRRGPKVGRQGRELRPPPGKGLRLTAEELNPALDLGRTQVNRLVLQVMVGFDEADGSASGPHQNGMGRRNLLLDVDSPQQRALADSGRGKDDIIPPGPGPWT